MDPETLTSSPHRGRLCYVAFGLQVLSLFLDGSTTTPACCLSWGREQHTLSSQTLSALGLIHLKVCLLYLMHTCSYKCMDVYILYFDKFKVLVDLFYWCSASHSMRGSLVCVSFQSVFMYPLGFWDFLHLLDGSMCMSSISFTLKSVKPLKQGVVLSWCLHHQMSQTVDTTQQEWCTMYSSLRRSQPQIFIIQLYFVSHLIISAEVRTWWPHGLPWAWCQASRDKAPLLHYRPQNGSPLTEHRHTL